MKPLAAGQVGDGSVAGVGVVVVRSADWVMVTGASLVCMIVAESLPALVRVLSRERSLVYEDIKEGKQGHKRWAYLDDNDDELDLC